MRERTLLLGEQRGMVGVLTEPSAEVGAVDRPLVVLLNAGLLPRIGPYRLWVRLARQLAAEGFAVLRFDLSGIGDSEPRQDALGFEEAALDDIRQVLDQMARSRGVRRFVLMGLCSGADNSYLAALRDDRIVGIVLMDGYAYRTPGFYLRYFGRRLLRRRSWYSLGRLALEQVRARLPRVLGPAPMNPSVRPVPDYVRAFPPRAQVAAGLRSLAARGVHIYVIYTSGMDGHYNHRTQFLRAFRDVDFRGHLTLDYFAESDHTFTELRSQRALVEAVVAWTRRAFPAHIAVRSAEPQVRSG
ncbi:MAG: alpha/beta fold hydrolase [Myxococcales bacterium]|nr:alpha/beta fold hydrolase [Myxococcota bacterium]MDW8284052.1 alpha/beta fold hydrolase [Myxococcales bacterium]